MDFIKHSLTNEIRLGTNQCLTVYTGENHMVINNANLTVFNIALPNEDIPDFTEKLPGVLRSCGFDSRKKTFVLLDCVASSVGKADFDLILKCLNRILPQGSAICFDYIYSVFGDEAAFPAGYNYNGLEALLDENSFLIYSKEDSADGVDYCLAVKRAY